MTDIPTTDHRCWVLCAKTYYSPWDPGHPEVKIVEVRMTGGKRPSYQWRELNDYGVWRGKRSLERIVELGYKFYPVNIPNPSSKSRQDHEMWGKVIRF